MDAEKNSGSVSINDAMKRKKPQKLAMIKPGDEPTKKHKRQVCNTLMLTRNYFTKDR